MSRMSKPESWSRRTFLKASAAGLSTVLADPFRKVKGQETSASLSNPLFWVDEIPDAPFVVSGHPNYHAGFEALLALMGQTELKLYRTSETGLLSGPQGLISRDDIVLIKVNAQWKYRGCTNSDLIRGLVQRILDFPGGFQGEVVIMENGQGRGSLACDTTSAYGGDTSVHANANDPGHSFLYLVDTLFNDSRVSAVLLDPIRDRLIDEDDHVRDGYRVYQNVSYPCFTTAGGHRVELKEGIWTGSGYASNLKLINVPVLKHHDVGGSEITACLKHMYGVLSMSDGVSGKRHYSRLGQTTGRMFAEVRTPVLNIVDAIWVSNGSITGYPEDTTTRANQLLASQDPVALDYWAARYILFPIDGNTRHHPDFPGIDYWLGQAAETINAQPDGLYDPSAGIQVRLVTKDEAQMQVFKDSTARFLVEGTVDSTKGKSGVVVAPAVQRAKADRAAIR